MSKKYAQKVLDTMLYGGSTDPNEQVVRVTRMCMEDGATPVASAAPEPVAAPEPAAEETVASDIAEPGAVAGAA